MKITKTYLTGCTWCGGTGNVPTKNYGMYTTPLTEPCPVCNGAKTVLVTETYESGDIKHIET
jgi:DnaJ-class molecular chaperone